MRSQSIPAGILLLPPFWAHGCQPPGRSVGTRKERAHSSAPSSPHNPFPTRRRRCKCTCLFHLDHHPRIYRPSERPTCDLALSRWIDLGSSPTQVSVHHLSDQIHQDNLPRVGLKSLLPQINIPARSPCPPSRPQRENAHNAGVRVSFRTQFDLQRRQHQTNQHFKSTVTIARQTCGLAPLRLSKCARLGRHDLRDRRVNNQQ